MGGESGGRTGRWITRLPSENQPGSESPVASTLPHLCQTLKQTQCYRPYAMWVILFQSVNIFLRTSEFDHFVVYVLPVCVSSLPGHVLLHLYGGNCHISVCVVAFCHIYCMYCSPICFCECKLSMVVFWFDFISFCFNREMFSFLCCRICQTFSFDWCCL